MSDSNSIDTSQGVSVGDAVLDFLANTTDLDAAVQRIPEQVQTSMGKAASSVSSVGDAVDDLTGSMAVGQNGAVKLGEVTTLAGTKVRESMYQARGEVGLLGEAFGITLPRHVRSFVAELPGVGAVLSAAFGATAVLFLIEALAKGVEKLQEWSEHAHKMALGWDEFNTAVATSFNGLNDKLLEAGIKMDELKGDHVDALKKEIELINHISLKELEAQFDLLAKAADAMFAKLASSWYEIGAGSKGAKNALTDFGAEYHLLLAEGKDKEASDLLAGTAKSANDALTRLQEAKKVADELNAEAAEIPGAAPSASTDQTEKEIQSVHVLVDALDALIKSETKINELKKDNIAIKQSEEDARQIEQEENTAKKIIATYQMVGEAKIKQWAAQAISEARFATDSAEAVLKIKEEQAEKEYQLKLLTLEKERAAEQHAASGYNAAGDEAAAKKQIALVAETNGKIEALNADHNAKMSEEQTAADNAAAARAVAAATIALDAQLAAIEKFKTEQLEAYAVGKIGLGSWEAAQVHAADAAAIAHEDSLKRIIAVYKQQGEAQKALEAEQQLATLEIESQTKANERLAAAMAKLTSATKQANEAEQKLAEDTLSQHYKDQETAITKLAAMHLITEEQKDDRLKLLESQQAAEALKILDDSLKAQQKLRDAAQAKLDAAKSNPASTTSELTDLQAELEKEVAAVAKAEDEKLKAREKFNQQSEANDKSHYGRAYLEAVGFGNQLLAEAMRENHAALIAKEQELEQAKARHENTDAIKEEIAALKQKEQALERAATGDTKAAAALLKHDQAQLAAAKTTLAAAQASGVDTTALQLHIKSLEADTAALDKAVNGDKARLAATLNNVQGQLRYQQALLATMQAEKLDTTAVQQNIVALQNQLKALQLQSTAFPKVTLGMTGLKNSLTQLTGGLKQFEQQTSQAFATAIMGALESGKSMGAALEAATKQILENLAEQALAKAIFYTAQGIADANTPGMEEFAPGEFAAAEMFGTIAGVAGAAGIAMPGGGGGSSSAAQQQGPSVGQTSSSSAGGGGSNQTVSVTKLAEGGVVSHPTMISPDVMAGDSKSGGAAEEAILPLSDPTAMRQVANAIASGGLPQSSPGEESAFDPQSIKKMMEAISSLTGTRDASEDFHFADSTASGEKASLAGTQSGTEQTVGEKLGFDFGEQSQSEKSEFQFASAPSPVTAVTPVASSPRSESSPRSFGPWGSPSTSDKPGFTFASGTVGKALGFNQPDATESEKPEFRSPESSVSEKSSFVAGGEPTASEKHSFVSPTPASVSQKSDIASVPSSESAAPEFRFGSPSPTTRESSGFTSGEPAPGEKPAFSPGGAPSESEKAQFLAAQPTVSEKQNFDRNSPTVGEALGFKFDTPYPGDKPVFSSGEPSAPEKPGFSLAAPSANEQRDFAASSATVGEALGFGFSSPAPSYQGLGFTAAPSSTSTQPGFSSGAPSPHEKQSLDIAAPSAGERPGFDYSAPSVPREMPDMASLAANFGGLLSQPTLRAASDAQAPMAAVSASSSPSPMDMEAHMERFASKMGAQMQPEGRSSSGGGDGGTTIVNHIKGLMDSGNLKKITKKQNRMVKNRQLTVKASDSLRVTRRSQ